MDGRKESSSVTGRSSFLIKDILSAVAPTKPPVSEEGEARSNIRTISQICMNTSGARELKTHFGGIEMSPLITRRKIGIPAKSSTSVVSAGYVKQGNSVENPAIKREYSGASSVPKSACRKALRKHFRYRRYLPIKSEHLRKEVSESSVSQQKDCRFEIAVPGDDNEKKRGKSDHRNDVSYRTMTSVTNFRRHPLDRMSPTWTPLALDQVNVHKESEQSTHLTRSRPPIGLSRIEILNGSGPTKPTECNNYSGSNVMNIGFNVRQPRSEEISSDPSMHPFPGAFPVLEIPTWQRISADLQSFTPRFNLQRRCLMLPDFFVPTSKLQTVVGGLQTFLA